MARRIFEDQDGLYFRAYDKNRRLVKVYCDEEGNPIKGRKVVPIVVEEKEKEEGGLSLKRILPILIPVFLIVSIIFAGFFVYNKIVNANPKVDISSNYEISLAPTGYNGEAKPGIKVNKIPTVENVKDEAQKKEIEDILNNPRVSYNKTDNLRNGDDVEVTVVLDETKVKKHNLQVTGVYKKTFKVEGLGEKPAVTGINPVLENQSITTEANSSSSRVTSTASQSVPSGTIPVPRTVKPAAVNIRTGAGTGNTVAGNLRRGGTVTEIRRVQNAKGETWSEVTYGNGKKGWIRSDLLS